MTLPERQRQGQPPGDRVRVSTAAFRRAAYKASGIATLPPSVDRARLPWPLAPPPERGLLGLGTLAAKEHGKIPTSMKDIESLEDLYFDQLQDILSVERQLDTHLPELARHACAGPLRNQLTHHANQTRKQIERLEQIFRRHGREPLDETSQAMQGLIQGGLEHVRSVCADEIRDALIVAHSNRVEHYEIAAYGTVVAIAGQLGFGEDARPLEESLEEEKLADASLTKLATGRHGRGLNASAEWAE